MSPELEQRLYHDIARAVLEGAPREKVLRTLEVNGITGDHAEQLYRRAVQERIAFIRGEGLRKVFKGLGSFGGGAAVFCGFWYRLGFIHRPVLVLSGGGMIFGAWWLLTGFFETALAARKTGSAVGDDE